MSNPMEERLAEALAEFEETRAKLGEAAAEAARISATVMARDRSVEATVGAQGELTKLRFPTARYRTMAPAQLADVLMTTIGAARAQAATQLAELYRPFGPIPGMDQDAAGGFAELDWNELFAPMREEGLPVPPVQPPTRSSGALLDELVDEEDNGAASGGTKR
ncbi:YbaB/EbfC family nucleoid-associated protein [Streptomyces sp. NPDC014734]|uniref:YbaB/EbfC family nucleoid-associated protein n=1 Tax=Streptomyces sp. NPDC014734 TaxID=3364886 RepID=UPI0036F4E084